MGDQPKSYIPPPPSGLPSYFKQRFITYIPSRSWVTKWIYPTTCYLNHWSPTYNNSWYLVVLSKSQYEAVIDVIGSVQGIYAFIYWTKWRFGQMLPIPDSLTHWQTLKERATQTLRRRVELSYKAIYNFTCTYMSLILHTTSMYYMVTTSIGGGPTVLN